MLQQSGHLAKYASEEHLHNTPPCNPNPPDVDVISIMTSRPQSEHLSFNSMVGFPGFASNIFLNIFIILEPKGRMKIFEKENINTIYKQIAPISR